MCVCIRESILYKTSVYYYHSMDIIQLQYVQSTIRNRNKVIIRGGVYHVMTQLFSMMSTIFASFLSILSLVIIL